MIGKVVQFKAGPRIVMQPGPKANQRLERAQRQFKELHDEAPELFAMIENLVVEVLAEIRS